MGPNHILPPHTPCIPLDLARPSPCPPVGGHMGSPLNPSPSPPCRCGSWVWIGWWTLCLDLARGPTTSSSRCTRRYGRLSWLKQLV